MESKDEGIIIKVIPFKESSVICSILTRSKGMQSFIVSGVRKKGKGNSSALFQPLVCLSFVYSGKEGALKRIREFSLQEKNINIITNPILISIAYFISEVLIKTIKEEQEDFDLFQFVRQVVVDLNKIESNYLDFNLNFLIGLSQIIGIDFTYESNYTRSKRQLLADILQHYRENIDHFGELKSISVLKSVLS